MILSTVWRRSAFLGCTILALLLCASSNLFAIDVVKVVRLEVKIGQTLDYEFYADFVASPPELEYHNVIDPYVYNGDVVLDPNNGIWYYGQTFSGTHLVQYTPTVQQPQRDTVYLMFDRLNENNQTVEHMEILIFDIVARSIDANRDFAQTKVDVPVTIDVLQNDISDYPNMHVAFVSLSNSGSCSINGDNQVVFTPAPGFSGVAAFEYTTCNNDNSCDRATVFIGVDQLQTDTITYHATEFQEVYLYDALEDYVLVQGANNGVVETTDLGAIKYSATLPNTSYQEELIYEHVDNPAIKKHFFIEVANATKPNVLTKADNYWVCEQDFIELSVLHNDLLPLMTLHLVQQASLGEVTYLGNGEMDYMVDPTSSAKQRDIAIYRAAAFNWSVIEYSKINFHIDEFLPLDVTYKLQTQKDVPLVLEYKTLLANPIDISVLVEPSSAGAPELELVEDSYTWNNQTCTGDQMVVFTPIQGMTYTEEFELLYSPGNGNSYPIKIEVEIIDEEAEACIGGNCVWPGDMDNNGVVDARDLLVLGYGIGSAGTPRTSGSTDWKGQFADSWVAPIYGTFIDYKYLDADGNGQVTAADTIAIIENYNNSSNIHPSRMYGVGNVNADASYGGDGLILERAPLYLFPHPDNPSGDLEIGDILLADIYLGVEENHANNIHGVSFTLTYETTQMDSTSVSVDFDANSWFTNNSSVLEITKAPQNGYLDAAITRTAKNPISGWGRIGQAGFIIIIDIDGIKTDKSTMTIQMDDIQVMDGDGQLVQYPATSFEVPVNTGSSAHVPPTLLAYPNPTHGWFNLHLNGGMDKKIKSYEIYNLEGKLIQQQSGLNQKSTIIDLTTAQAGIYVAKVVTDQGVVLNKKIEVIR